MASAAAVTKPNESDKASADKKVEDKKPKTKEERAAERKAEREKNSPKRKQRTKRSFASSRAVAIGKLSNGVRDGSRKRPRVISLSR